MSHVDLFNIKLKRYLTQYDYLETLLEETKILFEEYNQTFLQEYYNEEEHKKLAQKKEQEKSNNPKYNIETQTDNNTQNDNENNEINIDDDIIINDVDDLILKKLYKRLSLKTHPDKIKGKGDYFKKINIAHKKKDIIILVRIAKELDIDISDIIIDQSNTIISTFDKNIQTLEKEIHDLKHTVAWHWAHASPEEKQLYKEKTRSG